MIESYDPKRIISVNTEFLRNQSRRTGNMADEFAQFKSKINRIWGILQENIESELMDKIEESFAKILYYMDRTSMRFNEHERYLIETAYRYEETELRLNELMQGLIEEYSGNEKKRKYDDEYIVKSVPPVMPSPIIPDIIPWVLPFVPYLPVTIIVGPGGELKRFDDNWERYNFAGKPQYVIPGWQNVNPVPWYSPFKAIFDRWLYNNILPATVVSLPFATAIFFGWNNMWGFGSYGNRWNASGNSIGEKGSTGFSSGQGSFAESIKEMVEQVGPNAMKTSLDLIKAWMISEIIKFLIEKYVFFLEFSKYQTLGEDDIEIEPMSDEQEIEDPENKEEEITEKEEFEEKESEEEKINKEESSSENVTNEKSISNEENIKEEITEENKAEADTESIKDAEIPSEEEISADIYTTSESSGKSDTSIVSDAGMVQSAGSENISSSSSGAGGSDLNAKDMESESIPQVNDITPSESIIKENPDIIEGNVRVDEDMFRNKVGEASKSTISHDYYNSYKTDAYRSIFAANSSSISTGTAVAGTGAVAAGAGVFGTMIAKSLGGTAAAGVGSGVMLGELGRLTGIMEYVNLLDMVGSAEKCYLNYLNESKSILFA